MTGLLDYWITECLELFMYLPYLLRAVLVGPAGVLHGHAAGRAGADGQAVQVDPMKPTLNPPGTKRLKLMRDMLLSTSAFKSNLHHYMMGPFVDSEHRLVRGEEMAGGGGPLEVSFEEVFAWGVRDRLQAGAYTRSLSAQLELSLCPTLPILTHECVQMCSS